MPHHLTVNCRRCGTERIVPLPAPGEDEEIACAACAHREAFHLWVTHTVTELAKLSASRLARSR